MLQLKHGETILQTVTVGTAFTLPNGDQVSPAYAGWASGEFKLVEAPPPAPPTIEEQRDAALEALWAHRRSMISGSATINGIHLWVDLESRANLTAALLGAQIDPQMSVTWKTADGAFVTLAAPQLAALAQAVMAYVQGCFAREAQLSAEIVAAADPLSIDILTGWPN